MSWYITLRFDSTYSQSAPTQSIISFLQAQAYVKQIGPMDFSICSDTFVTHIIMAQCDVFGNYASTGEYLPEVNIVELTVPYTAPPAPYERLAAALAEYLGWAAFEDGEDRQIWPLP